MPRVLRPGNLSTFTRVTFDPTLFPVFPVILSLEKKKSFAVAKCWVLAKFSVHKYYTKKSLLLSDSSIKMDNNMSYTEKI